MIYYFCHFLLYLLYIYIVFMLKIGMDKTDRNFRKFEYDDERMYGNPQMFKGVI